MRVKIELDVLDLIDEHRRVIEVLDNGDYIDRQKEIKRQKHELVTYMRKYADTVVAAYKKGSISRREVESKLKILSTLND